MVRRSTTPVAAVSAAVAAAAVDDEDGVQWRWTMKIAFNGGSSIRRHSMVSVVDYDERARGRRKERQRNNQPAR